MRTYFCANPKDKILLRNITPLILAAGESSRIGFPKALLPLGRRTFVTSILDTLEELDLAEPCVILGSHAERIRPQLLDRRARVVINPDPRQGQLSSIKVALEQIEASCSACLIWPVDQPGVPVTVVRDLIQLFESTASKIVLPVYQDRRGHPALFSRSLFAELLATPLNEGARAVVLGHRDEIGLVRTTEAATVFDIDTAEDYLRLTGETLESAVKRSKQ
jgi:molybdenum cofactor cytidylyltransferase